METIKQNDFAILLISDEYLKSINCMYEVSQLMKDEYWDSKVMSIVFPNAKVYNIFDRVRYFDYWHDKRQQIDKIMQKCVEHGIMELPDEYQKIYDVQISIDDFLVKLNDTKNPSLDDAMETIIKRITESNEHTEHVVKNIIRTYQNKSSKGIEDVNTCNNAEYYANNSSTNKKDNNAKSNVYIIQDGIDTVEYFDSVIDRATFCVGHPQNDKPVCLIYTGGNAGYIRAQNDDAIYVLRRATLPALLDTLPKLRDLEFDVHFYSYRVLLDSSNITSEDWKSLARIIWNLYFLYQGFVIIHGSNTLAYTAAALSFMFENLDKPVILTGAELSLTTLNTDAERNIIRSLIIAAHQTNKHFNVGEVCIFYGKTLIRGNRATKKMTLDTQEGFYSPNYPALALFTNDKVVFDQSNIIKNSCPHPSYNEIIPSDTNIIVYDVYPDMNMDLFKQMCEYANLHAIILRIYGSEEIPNSIMFVKCLENLINRNIIIVTLTQNPIRSIDTRISEATPILLDKGIIHGGDMVTEAAYCKLKYLFARHRILSDKNDYIENIKREMMINLRGELSTSTHIVNFIGGVVIQSQGYYTVLNSFSGYYYNSRIHRITLRIEGIKIIEGRNNPVLHVTTYIDDRCLMEYKQKYIDDDGHELSINVDITNKAIELMRYTKKISLFISSTNHSFMFDSLRLIVSVRES